MTTRSSGSIGGHVVRSITARSPPEQATGLQGACLGPGDSRCIDTGTPANHHGDRRRRRNSSVPLLVVFGPRCFEPRCAPPLLKPRGSALWAPSRSWASCPTAISMAGPFTPSSVVHPDRTRLGRRIYYSLCFISRATPPPPGYAAGLLPRVSRCKSTPLPRPGPRDPVRTDPPSATSRPLCGRFIVRGHLCSPGAASRRPRSCSVSRCSPPRRLAARRLPKPVRGSLGGGPACP